MTKKMKRNTNTIIGPMRAGLKGIRTIESLERLSQPEKQWKTNCDYVRRSVRKRYPIHTGIMEEMWNSIFEKMIVPSVNSIERINSQGDTCIFIVADFYSDEVMDAYIDKYRRSFKTKSIPHESTRRLSQANQLTLFDADVDYFKIAFKPRWNRWINAKISKLCQEGVFSRKKNYRKNRTTSFGSILARKGLNSKQTYFEYHRKLGKGNQSTQKVLPSMKSNQYAGKSEKATTTESFMVTVFDIPLRDARALKPILGKSFSMYIADGSAISLITPEQFMEIRDIITKPSNGIAWQGTPELPNDEWDSRYLTAMKTLHNMLKKIAKDKRTAFLPDTGLKPTPVVVKKSKPVVVKEYKRKVRVNHLSPAAFSERVVRAELFAKWFKDNKTLLINDQKAAAFMFMHAIEKGELKW